MGFFKNGFTLMVFSQNSLRSLRIHIPRWAFVFLLFTGVGGSGYLGYLIFDAQRVQKDFQGLWEMRHKYLMDQVALMKIGKEVDTFKGEINRVRELDTKLRLIADLKPEYPVPSLYRIGGSIDAPTGQEANQKALSLVEVLERDLPWLRDAASQQVKSFQTLKLFLMEKRDILRRSPHRWPVRGFLSSGYGPRSDPFTGMQRMHEGVDIVAARGTRVIAPADGIVTYAGHDGIFGKMVVIDHGYGLITRYGHMDEILTEEGGKVLRGDEVGTVGSEGRSTGPHLHYEIRINDVAVNPLKYIFE